MAKERKQCQVVLYKDGDGTVCARYIGVVGSTDDESLAREVIATFSIGANQSKANDLMTAAEAAFDSDESIS